MLIYRSLYLIVPFLLSAVTLPLYLFGLIIILFKESKYLGVKIIITALIIRMIIVFIKPQDLVKNFTDILRLEYFNKIAIYFPKDLEGLITSITIGSDQRLDSNLSKNFRKFNLIHLLSISGGNFIIIKAWVAPLTGFLKKQWNNLIVICLQSIYICFIGIDNPAALRAYIFSAIDIFAKTTGKPIKFIDKILVTSFLIGLLDLNLITSLSFILSITFSVIYKLMGSRYLSSIFNTELKKLTFTFLFGCLIFNSQQPDYLANILFALAYPLIFTTLSINLITSTIFNVVNLDIIINIVRFLLSYLNEISSVINTNLQLIIFIVSIILIFYKSTAKSNTYANR